MPIGTRDWSWQYEKSISNKGSWVRNDPPTDMKYEWRYGCEQVIFISRDFPCFKAQHADFIFRALSWKFTRFCPNSLAISRNTEPILDMLVLLLMHFSYRIQIWLWQFEFWKCWNFWPVVCMWRLRRGLKLLVMLCYNSATLMENKMYHAYRK